MLRTISVQVYTTSFYNNNNNNNDNKHDVKDYIRTSLDHLFL